MSPIFKSIKSSNSEHNFIQSLLCPFTFLEQLSCQLSSLNIAYLNTGFNSFPLTSLVIIYDSCRSPLHHIVLYKLHSSPFPTKCILLGMCMVCLVSLPFLDMHISYFISNIKIGACSKTTSRSLFNN